MQEEQTTEQTQEKPKRTRKSLSIDEKIAKMQENKLQHEKKAKDLGEKIEATRLEQISLELKKIKGSPEEIIALLKQIQEGQKVEN